MHAAALNLELGKAFQCGKPAVCTNRHCHKAAQLNDFFHRTEMFCLNTPFLQPPKSVFVFVFWQVWEETRSVFSVGRCATWRAQAGASRECRGCWGQARAPAPPAGAPLAPGCGLGGFQLSWKPLHITRNKQTNNDTAQTTSIFKSHKEISCLHRYLWKNTGKKTKSRAN